MEPQGTVSAEEFFKVDLRVGKVENAEPLENSEKLIRLTVDFNGETRNILAGLLPFYEQDFFVGKLFVFAYNLQSRKMAGEESQGMMLCVDGDRPVPIVAPEGSVEGDKIK